MATNSEELATAIRHHQAGRLKAAEQIYRQILGVEPNHADAWHLLGVASAQLGKHQAGVDCIRRALTLKPGFAEAHNNLGNSLKEQGKLDEAVACFHRALELKPEFAAAQHNLGNVFRDQGKRDEAIACYRRVLELKPDFAEAHNNLGNVLAAQGKLDEAAACYRQALLLMPRFTEAHINLGNALRGQGKLDEAAACHRQAVALKPDHPEAHIHLGNTLREQGKWDDAITCHRRALELKPDFAEAHNDLGAALHDQGKLDEAVACYRRALKLKPAYAEAHNNLGLAFRELEKWDEAVICFRRALELKPDYTEAFNNLGIALLELGNVDDAIGCCRRALELNPQLAEAHNNLGFALWEQGKPDEAVASYRRALDLKPDYAEANNNLGIALKGQGKLDQAIDCYRRVVQLDAGGIPEGQKELPEAVPGRPPAGQTPRRHAEMQNRLAKAFGQLAVLLHAQFPEDDWRVMQQLAAEPNLRDDGRAALLFGLAQILDTRGDYSAAASHLQEANAARSAALKKRKRGYSPDKHQSFIRGMLDTFTSQFFTRVSGFGLETGLPVFIMGLPRSGTTLVEQILASHSQVCGGGELTYCEQLFQSLPKVLNRRDAPFPCLLDLDRETTRSLAQQHLDRLRALDEKAHVIVDKMPGNYEYLGFIRLLFPQARLIHCRRDFRDVALSCRIINFASLPWTCDEDHLVSYFEEYSRLMDHWRRVLPAPPLDVHYEEMVEDTEGSARRIIQWCGLDWEPACLRFYETQRPVRTASVAQVRRPIYTSSVGRWKNYEKFLGELFSRVHHIERVWSDSVGRIFNPSDPGRTD